MDRYILTITITLTPLTSIHAAVSTNVPLNHWSYNAIDQLTQNGLILSDMPSTRPYTRMEMARLIVEGKEHVANAAEITKDIIARLQREFLYEVKLHENPGMNLSGGYLKPIEDPYIRFIQGKHPPSLDNEAGDIFHPDNNWRAGFSTHGVFWNRIGFYVHPEYKSPWATDTGVRLIEGYGKTSIGCIDIQLGKDSLWWGPGHHGAMIMSRNAEGLPMLKVSTSDAVLLPWVFRCLGPLKFTYFLSELEKERYQPRTKFTGIRLNFKPHPCFDLGFSRTIMFGGDNFKANIGDYLQILWPKNIQSQENQLAAIDASIRIPMPKKLPWRALKLYGEYAGEDAAGFSKYVPLLGFQIQDIGWRGSTDFRMEFARTNIHGFPNTFYQHGLFQSGYTYKGKVMGHHIGTDTRDVYARFQHYLNAQTIVGIDFDQEVMIPYRQTRNQYGVDFSWFSNKNWELRARYQYEDVRRDPTRPGWNHILDIGVTYNF